MTSVFTTTGRRKYVAILIVFTFIMMVVSYKRKYVFLAQRKTFLELRTTKMSIIPPTRPPVRKIWFNWNSILKFLPKVKYCDDLKSILPDRKFPWDYTYAYKKFNMTFTEILKAHPLPYQVEPPEVFTRILFQLVTIPWVNIVCDVDFTFGYEQVLFSTVKPNSQTFTFTDVADMWPLKGPMFAYVSHKHRRNVNFIRKKTPELVKDFLKTHQHCEFLLMGQYHKAKQIEQDVLALSELANPGGHILVWELTKHSATIWEDSKRNQLVKEYFSCRFKGKELRGIAVGHFLGKKMHVQMKKQDQPKQKAKEVEMKRNLAATKQREVKAKFSQVDIKKTNEEQKIHTAKSFKKEHKNTNVDSKKNAKGKEETKEKGKNDSKDKKKPVNVAKNNKSVVNSKTL